GGVVFQIVESSGGNLESLDGHPRVPDGDHIPLSVADDFRPALLHRFQSDRAVDRQISAVFTGIYADHVAILRLTNRLDQLPVGLSLPHLPDGGLRLFRHPHEKDRYEDPAEDDFSFHNRSPQSPSATVTVPRIRK